MIDAHHHLWSYSPGDYAWIPPGSELARDQLAPELETVTDAAGVTGTVAVQARQVPVESDFLLSLADRTERILGVVGWVPLIEPDVDSELERLSARKKFKGVRHVLQDEPNDYFLRDDFHRGLAMLPGFGLSYDLLLFQRQLPVAVRLVDRQPGLEIVVDHLAKPEARNGRVEQDWRAGMRELAERDHVAGVKFSGLMTEFKEPADDATLRAYFDETLEIFGTERVMVGSDWPVCLLATDYGSWAGRVRKFADELTESERAAVLGGNARRVYRL